MASHRAEEGCHGQESKQRAEFESGLRTHQAPSSLAKFVTYAGIFRFALLRLRAFILFPATSLKAAQA
jgi:hypothetical protein